MRIKIISVIVLLVGVALSGFVSNNSIKQTPTTKLKAYQMVRDLTDSTFAKETAKGVVLVDFWAVWCGPCRRQGPIIEDIALTNTNKNVKICKLDVDHNKITSRKFSVSSIPTIIIFKDGKMVDQMVGLQMKQTILDVLKKHTN